MKKVFLALGSNIGNRSENLKKSIDLLSENVKIEKISKVYISKAVGYEEQPYFYNMALKGYTSLPPEKLLKFIKQVEKDVGRIYRFHWGPREIDIDILFYENMVINSKKLTIPHPRIQERDFVLKPLMDLEPDFLHPVLKKSVKELYLELTDFSITGMLEL